TILENVSSTSKQEQSFIRTVLARLNFLREDVYKVVGTLSGGERVKVALAKIFVSDINMLILDEPTNYLDIKAAAALESLLKEYEGTV
ncbi:ATP-binding cassette domain-containing protein, partial [Pseudomonas sp. 2822-17]|uniref:ATP-binding cassette domain-containing protein n=1 Tax=Pseudomonas sp. 2822-17 TaxID=1712678 RepID=UPI000C62EFA7